MTGLTLATIRTQARRYVGPGLAIVLGVAFVATTLVLSSTLTASIRTAVAGDLGSWSAVATPEDARADGGPSDGGATTLPEKAPGVVEALPGVARVVAERRGILVPDASSDVLVVSTPPTEGSGVVLTDGRMPTDRGEVALGTDTARSLHLTVGDRFATPQGSADVVGLADTSAATTTAGIGTVYASPDEVTALTGVEGWTQLRVAAADGTSDTALVDEVSRALGSSATVRTGPDAAAAAVEQMTNGRDVITGLLLAFAAIALLVSAIVIANTFSVLLARRARETPLLRVVGATRAQVLRSALLESLLLGLAASLAGAGVGVLAARGLAAASGSSDLGIPLTTFSVPVSAVLVPTAVGLVVTTVAALVPVVRSSRITPMAALRPDLAVTVRSRRGRVRIGLGVLAMLGGGLLLAAGAFTGILVAGIVGGAASFVGVLLAGSVVVPPVARAVGLLPARLAGVPGEMAVDNTVREPSRTAATASALLVGVTLVVMMSVGAATGQRSVTTALDDRFAVDVAVTASDEDLAPDVTARLAGIGGVAEAADLTGVTASVGDSDDATVLGVAPGSTDVVRGGAFDGVRPGVLVAEAGAAADAGLDDDERTTVVAGDRSVDLTVRVEDHAAVPFAVSARDLDTLAGDPGVRATLLRLDDAADPSAVVSAAKAVVAGTGAAVGGGAPMRAQFDDLVETLLAVVTALLTVSIVIAVVGIGTSLSLSVIERTRELGLVRALGMTRLQLRGMLAGEAVLLAVVATLVGSALGIVYGVAGPMSVFGRAVEVSPQVPWGRLGLVGLAAVVSGLAASVLPARRAARIAPASALAED